MARKLKEFNIEQLVRAFLSKFRNENEKREVRRFIQKAIKQIDFFLNSPCCDDLDATIQFGRGNNALTTYITAIFNNKQDKRKWKHSLQRTRDLLFNFIEHPCCDPINGNISVDALAGLAGNAGVLFFDIDTSLVNFVSGTNFPIEAGQSGIFNARPDIYKVTVLADNNQVGMKWRLTDSNGTIQEAPYVGGNSEDFFNFSVNNNGTWTIEIVPV
jgi:hypothetical protein